MEQLKEEKVLKQKWQLYDLPHGSHVVLNFGEGDDYEGIFKSIDFNNGVIFLETDDMPHSINLPLIELQYFYLITACQ